MLRNLSYDVTMEGKWLCKSRMWILIINNFGKSMLHSTHRYCPLTTVRWWAGWVDERFRAQATFVRSLSGMNAHMIIENASRCKCTSAKRTNKLLDASMRPSHVRSQVTTLKERTAAYIAQKRSLAIVHEAMHLQHAVGHERARTVGAFVRSANDKMLWRCHKVFIFIIIIYIHSLMN